MGVVGPTRMDYPGTIAAVHAEAARFVDTDWSQIVALYDVLQGASPRIAEAAESLGATRIHRRDAVCQRKR